MFSLCKLAGVTATERADAVVVGGGTVGGWCAWWLRQLGVADVVLVERRALGQGASSRAAGMVRAQGGTQWAVRLGMFSRDFYRRQREELGFDSGFVEQGYFMPAFTQTEVAIGKARVEMQRSFGLDVSWMAPKEAAPLNPHLQGEYLGGSYAAGDGYLDPPRNVAAYAAALLRAGVSVREGTSLLSLDVRGGKVVAVETSAGRIDTGCVVLTGGPELGEVGRLAGLRLHAGGTRHQVAVTEPMPELAPASFGAMVFDISAGLYWRPEDGGMLFGMSNPVEPPGPARDVDWQYMDEMRARLADLVPITRSLTLRKVWAATIDYTPDHLPILGPAITVEGDAIAGVTVASAGGHGMMWGPGVARIAADLALEGRTDVVGDVEALGMDRFDDAGKSRLDPDPIALPFPAAVLSKDL
jgi:sarcosine oxidase subunit beta